jgi:hypothetical protein
MRIWSMSVLTSVGAALLVVGSVQAANTNPPGTKESKPATSTMSGTEQQGNNAGRNANTKPTQPAPPPKK